MHRTNLNSFLARPCIKENFIHKNRRVLDPEYLNFLKEHKWTGPVIIDITGTSNFWMYHSSDDKVSGLYFYYGKDSFESLSCILFGLLSKKASTIYDIGGHCGIYSLIAASSKVKNIHYFDILESVTDRLELNIQLNKFNRNTNFHINRFGLSCSNGSIEFNYNEVPLTSGASIENLPNTFSGKLARKGIANVITLDEYWFSNKKHNVDLIKIDVEMHEESVLQGGKEFFNKNKPYIICEVLSNEQFNNLYHAFIEIGYSCAYEINDDKMLLRRIHQDMKDSNGIIYQHSGQHHNVIFTKNPLSNTILIELEKLIKSSPNTDLTKAHIQK